MLLESTRLAGMAKRQLEPGGKSLPDKRLELDMRLVHPVQKPQAR
jgi:hypothetical protein